MHQRLFVQVQGTAGAVGGVMGADGSLLRRAAHAGGHLSHLGQQLFGRIARLLGLPRGQQAVGH